MGPLAGFTVGITGDRRSEEQAELLARRGAQTNHGPVMHTRLLSEADVTLVDETSGQEYEFRPDLLMLLNPRSTKITLAVTPAKSPSETEELTRQPPT